MVSGGDAQEKRSKIVVRMATEDDADMITEMGAKLAYETEDKTLDKELVKTAVIRCI